MHVYSLTFTLMVALLASAAVHSQDKAQSPPYDLVVVGDVMLGRMVGKELEARQASPWANVIDGFPKSHLRIGNFEAAVTAPGLQCLHPGDLCLTVLPKNLALLQQAGFTHMSVANNHAADLGADGKESTRAALMQNGITPVDADWNLAFSDVDGLRVVMLAISLVPDALGHASDIPSLALAQQLSLARALADKVVVIVHWGNELQPWASQQQRDAARWLIAQGADMIFGHHPHVVQPPECVDGRPVWYSLGNHVFDQKYQSTHTGAMAACRFSRDSDDTTCDSYQTTRSVHSASLEQITLDQTRTPLKCSPAKRNGGRIGVNAAVGAARNTYNLYSRSTADSAQPLATNLPLRKLERIDLPSGQEGLLMLLELESPFDKVLGLRPHVYRLDHHQLLPVWRGSALAYPVEDLKITKDAAGRDVMCVLHEPVSHLGRVRVSSKEHLVLAYRWNGFGFNVDPARPLVQDCTTLLYHLRDEPETYP
jgi:poly-gamma-glutamate synthesis protein (capsule biosynthesis protein)